MEEILIVLQHVQQENQSFRDYVMHLQNNQASMSLECIPTMQIPTKEHRISLPEFDGIRSKFN
jgi:hypothetical protein